MMVTEIAIAIHRIQIHRGRDGWYVTFCEVLIDCNGPEDALRVALSLADELALF